MKIDATSKYPVYRSKIGGFSNKTSSISAAQPGKTDVVEFSRGQTAVPDKSMAALKAGLLRDINEPTDARRLEALKAQIKSGDYRTPTEDLVDAILNEKL